MRSQNAKFVIPLRDQYSDAFGHLWLLIHSSFATFPGQRLCLCFVLTCTKGFWDMTRCHTARGVSDGLFSFPEAFWKTPKLFLRRSHTKPLLCFVGVCESDILLQFNHIFSLPLPKNIKYRLGTNTGFI